MRYPVYIVVFSGAGIRFPIFLGILSHLQGKVLFPTALSAIYGTSGGALAGLLIKLALSINPTSPYTALENLFTSIDFKGIIKQTKLFGLLGLLRDYGKYTWNKKAILKMLEKWFIVNGKTPSTIAAFRKSYGTAIQVPLYAFATSLSDYNYKKLTGTSLDGDIDNVIASAAAPYYFVPKKIENVYYIDGGLTKQLPIDVALQDLMNDINARKYQNSEFLILAVNMSQKMEIGPYLQDYSTVMQDLRYYLQKVDHTPQKLDGWSELVERIISSILTANTREAIDDVILWAGEDTNILKVQTDTFMNIKTLGYLVQHKKARIKIVVANVGVADIPSFAIDKFTSDRHFRYLLYKLGKEIGEKLEAFVVNRI